MGLPDAAPSFQLGPCLQRAKEVSTYIKVPRWLIIHNLREASVQGNLPVQVNLPLMTCTAAAPMQISCESVRRSAVHTGYQLSNQIT